MGLPSRPPPAPQSQTQLRAKPLRLDRSARVKLERSRLLAAELFALLLAERGTSNVEMAEAIGVSERYVRDFRSTEPGRKPIGVRHVLAMPRRLALAYLDAVRSAVLNDNISGHE